MIRSVSGVPVPRAAYAIHKYGRYWEVLDPAGDLVCVTVYKCGAREVVRRLGAGRTLRESEQTKRAQVEVRPTRASA